MASLDSLQSALDYRFRDAGLLERALTHRSHGMPHNERLEFLGDSVLNFVVSTLLFAEHAEMDEGEPWPTSPRPCPCRPTCAWARAN